MGRLFEQKPVKTTKEIKDGWVDIIFTVPKRDLDKYVKDGFIFVESR